MDDLFNEVKDSIERATTIDIGNDKEKQDKFIKITKEVADICMTEEPNPSIQEYRKRVVDTAYHSFIQSIQGLSGAQYPPALPPFQEPRPIPESVKPEILGIPKMELDKSMKLYQSTQPKSQINDREKKVLIIDTGEFGDTDMPAETDKLLTSFTADLSETFQVPGRENGQCEIYLDSFTVSGSKCAAHNAVQPILVADEQYFMIGISQFKINTKSNYSKLNGKFIIPNDNSEGTKPTGRTNVNVLKSKKFNYIGQMNVGVTFDSLDITITIADALTTIFSDINGLTNRIIMEFLFIPV